MWPRNQDSNPPLSATDEKRKSYPRVAFFFVWTRREAGRLRALRGGFEGSGLQARPSPNRPTAAAARHLRAPAARVRGSNWISAEYAFTSHCVNLCLNCEPNPSPLKILFIYRKA